VAVDDANPSQWTVVTNERGASILRLHLAALPGWHATIDGRPLALASYSGLMSQAVVPPGHHVVVLRYWPDVFTLGLVVALVTLLALGAGLAMPFIASRRGRVRAAAPREG